MCIEVEQECWLDISIASIWEPLGPLYPQTGVELGAIICHWNSCQMIADEATLQIDMPGEVMSELSIVCCYFPPIN